MRQRLWWLIWAAAALAVLLVTVWPLSAIVSHPHWDRVSWIPFADSRDAPWKLAANVLLFLPFGYAGTRVLGGSRWAAVAVLLLGAALTMSVETAQLFTHGRFPSATDVVANFAGAALGVAVARRENGGPRAPGPG